MNGNKALLTLYCSDNQFSRLELANNTALEELFCYNNQLTQLHVSDNSMLVRLHCDDNQLAEIDISNNVHLTMFSCIGNPGENGVLRVKVWPGFGSVPMFFSSGSYDYGGGTVTIEYWNE